MKHIKKIILRAFFVCEIIGFGWIYLFGAHGIKNFLVLQEHTNKLVSEISCIKEHVVKLETEITQFNTYPFYKEKIAREQLQMAAKNDRIYIVK